MWLAGKAFVCLVILMTTGHFSPAAQSEVDTTPVVKVIGHVTEPDAADDAADDVTVTSTFDDVAKNEADDTEKQQKEKESPTQEKGKKNSVATHQRPFHRDLENDIKNSGFTDAMIANSAAINAKDTSNAINSMPDIARYSGKGDGGVIKNHDSDMRKAGNTANDKEAINGRLNAVHNKATMKELGNEITDGTDYKDKAPDDATHDTMNLRAMALVGSDVTSAITSKGLTGVTNNALDVSNKHDTEAPPLVPFENTMTEDTWTDSTKVSAYDSAVSPSSPTTGWTFKARPTEGAARTTEEGIVSTPSTSPNMAAKSDAVESQESSSSNQTKASEHAGSEMSREPNIAWVTNRGNQTALEGMAQNNGTRALSKCPNTGGCQSEAAADDSAVSADLHLTLGGTAVTPDDLGAANDVAKGTEVHRADTASNASSETTVEAAAGEATAPGGSSNDRNQGITTATDATVDAGPGMAAFASREAGHFESGNSSMASYTQAPPKRLETDYVSIEEAKSLTNDTDEDEMPSILKVYLAEKSTPRPNKDVTESLYSPTSMNYSDILPTESLQKKTTSENQPSSHKNDNTTKEHLVRNSNDSRSFMNVTMQHNDDVTRSNETTLYPTYDYDQDYDYIGGEADEVTNTTVENKSGFPPKGSRKEYNKDINRTKQRVALEPSTVTDSDVTLMSRASAPSTTDEHKTLSKDIDKKLRHDIFKPQPHIATHHKRVYPPHAFHGLIWEDRRYLVSVLVPVGCGVAGALVIVCLAYAARSCQTRRAKKPEPAPQLTAADIAYMDKLMLLADSSDDDV